jgi:hypothetical protein
VSVIRILDEGFGADFDIFCIGSVRERTRFVGAIDVQVNRRI